MFFFSALEDNPDPKPDSEDLLLVSPSHFVAFYFLLFSKNLSSEMVHTGGRRRTDAPTGFFFFFFLSRKERFVTLGNERNGTDTIGPPRETERILSLDCRRLLRQKKKEMHQNEDRQLS